MLHKTRGIVFKVTDFRETSVVAQIYTEHFGLQGFLINSVRKKNAKFKQNALHPLALVDLEVYHKDKKGLHRIADIRANPVLQSNTTDVKKTSIIFFLNEVLNKSVHEEEANPKLFEFLFNAVNRLEEQNPADVNFHLDFLVRLSKHLGFDAQYDPEIVRLLQNMKAMSRDEKRMFTAKLLDFYRLHLPPFSTLRSLEILEMIWE